MMKAAHQIRAFRQILEQYNGNVPLHRFLFTYFKQHREMGSSDRRWATRHIYSYFRLGRALADQDVDIRLAVADFLCNAEPGMVTSYFLSDLTAFQGESTVRKVELIRERFGSFNLDDVFAFSAELSEGITRYELNLASFVQPDLFIRVKLSAMDEIIARLKANHIECRQIGNQTLALPNGTKLEQLIQGAGKYQVQDLSSQKTALFFQPGEWEYWWDCCAASGGKSLLLHDLEPKVQLLVSDYRSSSLENLDERFREAGIRKYQKKVLDLVANNDPDLHHYEFDGIILDAPCSGSGTWRRTPEMLHYFDPVKINSFSRLQKAISGNVVKYLKPGKPLIYITCSVFREENEYVVSWMQENLPLKLERMETITGYAERADSMFVARLIKV